MWPIWCHFTPALNLIVWYRVDYMKSSCSSLSAKEGRKKAKPVSEILTGFFLAGRDTTLQNRPPLPLCTIKAARKVRTARFSDTVSKSVSGEG